MKYLCLVYLAEQKLHAVHDRECMAYATGLQSRGVLVAAEPLQPVDTATTVRVRNGRTTVTDGPFAETAEQLAGFYLVDAADLNGPSASPLRFRPLGRAVSRSVPCASSWSIEMQPGARSPESGAWSLKPERVCSLRPAAWSLCL
jgi:hypothetical protein